MEIIDNKAICLNVRNPNQITKVIPKSKQVKSFPDGGGQVLVNWGLDEAQVLKSLGIKNVPSPIRHRYKWPGVYKPMDHQRVTAEFLTMHRRAHCFNEQGTAKTASAAWAADYLMNEGKINRVLIICPLSIMDAAWQADLFRVCMHRRVDIAHGTPEKRRKVIDSEAEFVIINYDGVKVVLDDLRAGGFDLIICDEASALKNAQTDRWKAVAALLRPDTWLWLMTGTPAAQSPLDAYGLAKLVSPQRVPRFFGAWRDRVMFKINEFKWVPKDNSAAIVHEALQPAIRFTKEECLDLPELLYTFRNVPLTKQQLRYYDQMRKKFQIEAAGEEVTSVNAAVKVNKLLQISGGSAYTDSGEALEFDCSNRYAVVKEIVDESSQKVLIFVPYRHAILLVTDKLRADGITVSIIDGSISAGKRTEAFKAFQETPEPRVLVIQPQAAAHGVTLTAANTVIWWGPTSSVEIFAQANARVHRQGQRHPCTIVQIAGSPVERHVYTMLNGSIDIHTKMIDLYKKVLE